MLILTLFLAAAACAAARARSFNITHLSVPAVVEPDQLEVDVECRYDANFTLLSWFKGSHEFFRYRPGAAPSTRSFPILGVGTVEMLACGPTACRLRLGALTEDATGIYRCDIERDVPPYKFETRTAHMEVRGRPHRKPLLEGLAREYGEGDIIQAYCRGAPGSELRWYINGQEVEEARGSPVLKQTSTRLIYMGIPPTVVLQCAEFRNGKIYDSRKMKIYWNEVGNMRQDDTQVKNKSNTLMCFSYLGMILCFVKLNM